MMFYDFHNVSMIFNDFLWFLNDFIPFHIFYMIFIDFLKFPLIFFQTLIPLLLLHVWTSREIPLCSAPLRPHIPCPFRSVPSVPLIRPVPVPLIRSVPVPLRSVRSASVLAPSPSVWTTSPSVCKQTLPFSKKRYSGTDFHYVLIILTDFHWFSMIFNDFHWLSLIYYDFQWFSFILYYV